MLFVMWVVFVDYYDVVVMVDYFVVIVDGFDVGVDFYDVFCLLFLYCFEG